MSHFLRPKTKYDSFVPRYEALIQGKMEYAVEYRERIYIFETEQKREKFLRFEAFCVLFL